MTEKQKLNCLSKEEIIDVILNKTGPFNQIRNIVISACEETAVSKYDKQLEEIADKQSRCNLMTYKGRIEYARLEKEYKKVDKIFSALCGVDDLIGGN